MLDRFARALESAQAKIGIDGSAVTSSLDYKIANATVAVKKAGSTVGTRKGINFIEGTNVTLTITDDAGNNEVDVTVSAAGASGAPSTCEYLVGVADAGLSAERVVTDTATVSWDLAAPGTAKANVIDGSVTYAKIQDVSAASKLLGRGDSGAGDPQEITLGTNLSITGTTLNAASGGVSDGDKGDITVSGGGATWTIDAGVVSDAKLRDSAGTSVIGRGAGTTGAPADIAAASDNHVLRRSGGALGFGTIDAASIGAGTIDTARLGSGTPDSTKFLRGDQTWAAPTGGSGLTYPQVLSAAWMLG